MCINGETCMYCDIHLTARGSGVEYWGRILG